MKKEFAISILALLASASGFKMAVADVGPPTVGHHGSSAPVQLAQLRGDLYASNRYSVRNLQRVLNSLGYDAGPDDGLMGARTRSAIRAYQSDRNLLATGTPSASLYSHARATLAERTAARTRSSQVASDLIIRVQSALRRRGYDVPVISGSADGKTARAIAAYQRDAGLTVTGRPSRTLLAHLERSGKPFGSRDGRSRREIVTGVQRELNKRGYDAGPADGAFGPKTRSAIRTYQSDAGLPITGQVSAGLLARLEKTETAPTDTLRKRAGTIPTSRIDVGSSAWMMISRTATTGSTQPGPSIQGISTSRTAR